MTAMIQPTRSEQQPEQPDRKRFQYDPCLDYHWAFGVYMACKDRRRTRAVEGDAGADQDPDTQRRMSMKTKLYTATFNHGAIEETFYALDDSHASAVAHEIAARSRLCFDAVKEHDSTPPVVCEPRRGCVRD